MSENKAPYGKPDTIGSIERILGDYFERGNSMHINELLDTQDKLSIHSYRLASMAADCKGLYNTNVFNKKITINRQVQSLLNAKLTKAAATVQAESSKIGEEMIEAELKTESEAFKYDLLLGQVNRVISSMSQRISYLKQEHNNTRV